MISGNISFNAHTACTESSQAGLFAFDRPRGRRVGNHEDVETSFNETRGGLNDADMRLHTRQDRLPATERPECLSEALIFHAREVHLRQNHTVSGGISDLGNSLSEPLGILLGQQRGDAGFRRRLKQKARVANRARGCLHRRNETLLHVDDDERRIVSSDKQFARLPKRRFIRYVVYHMASCQLFSV